MIKPTATYSLSDIHLGHPNTPAAKIGEEILEVFTEEFKKYIDLEAQNIVVYFAGDVFDRLITLAQQDVHDIDIFIFNFLRLCKRYNAQVYVLEGTPSHDWKQSRRFVLINDEAKLGVDLKYIETLTIDYNHKTDMHVLFVPDEWDDDPKETFRQVEDLMKANNLTQVDLAVMHGNFTYQLPEIARVPKHDERSYLDIVKYVIYIGHIHIHSSYERIYAQGSFSRLTHGEEEPKGMVATDIYPDGTFKARFIENKNATIYKSIDVSNLPIEEAFKKLQEFLLDIPQSSNIRIVAEAAHPIFADKLPLIRHRPDVRWTFKKLKKEEIELSEGSFIDDVIEYEPVIINSQTVMKQLQPYLERRLESDKLDRANYLLKGLIADVS